MTIERTLAPARSDLQSATAGETGDRRTPRRPFLWHGNALTLGTLAWSASILAFGLNPTTPAGLALFALGSGCFQLGLLALLRVLWRSEALGGGRLARGFLRVETVLVLLALLSTTMDGLEIANPDQLGWLLLDATWPLSMLGMFAFGIRIAVAGRWHGVARVWPMVAESWAVICIPAVAILGPAVGAVVAGLHLVVGYAVLGQVVARKVAAHPAAGTD